MAKTYGQFCSVARSLDVVGDRWALLVVRELLLGPCRFTDLQGGLPGVGTNVLSTRLRELEAAGVVERHRLPAPTPAVLYELTDKGRELRGVVDALARWGSERLDKPAPGEATEPRWFALGATANVDPAGLEEGDVLHLRIDGEDFTMTVEADRLTARRGPPDADTADATLTGTLADFFATAKGDHRAAGRITVDGGRAAGRRFLRALTSSFGHGR